MKRVYTHTHTHIHTHTLTHALHCFTISLNLPLSFVLSIETGDSKGGKFSEFESASRSFRSSVSFTIVVTARDLVSLLFAYSYYRYQRISDADDLRWKPRTVYAEFKTIPGLLQDMRRGHSHWFDCEGLQSFKTAEEFMDEP